MNSENCFTNLDLGARDPLQPSKLQLNLNRERRGDPDTFAPALVPAPSALLIASKALVTPFPPGGLSTANRQMEKVLKIIVGMGKNFPLIIIRIIILLLAPHSLSYQVYSHL